jgi:hypothetical protein
MSSFSLREKVAEGRMRGKQCYILQRFPLTLALSLKERGFLGGYHV